ncbi:MAG: hypothetical protein AAF696_01865 [Bacteroidota bacterium]
MKHIYLLTSLAFILFACNESSQPNKKVDLAKFDMGREKAPNLDSLYADSLLRAYNLPYLLPKLSGHIVHLKDGSELGFTGNYVSSTDGKVPLKDIHSQHGRNIPAGLLSNLECDLDIIYYYGEDSETVQGPLLRKEMFAAYLSKEVLDNGLMMEPQFLEFNERRKTFEFEVEVMVPGQSKSQKLYFELDHKARLGRFSQ